MRLYHGTRANVAQDILSTGLQPSPSGRLGPGVYFSTEQGARNVADFRGNGNNAFLVICDVNLGRIRDLGHDSGTGWQHGPSSYDSAHSIHPAWANNKTAFDEWCVRDPGRVRIIRVEGAVEDHKQECRGIRFHPGSSCPTPACASKSRCVAACRFCPFDQNNNGAQQPVPTIKCPKCNGVGRGQFGRPGYSISSACPTCLGKCYIPDPGPKCPKCNGVGFGQLGRPGHSISSACPTCLGKCYIPNPGRKCPKCNGVGFGQLGRPGHSISSACPTCHGRCYI